MKSLIYFVLLLEARIVSAQFPESSGYSDPEPADFMRVTNELEKAVATASDAFDQVTDAKAAAAALELSLHANRIGYLREAMKRWLTATEQGLGDVSAEMSRRIKDEFAVLKQAEENIIAKYNTSPSVLRIAETIRGAKTAAQQEYEPVDRLSRNKGNAYLALTGLAEIFDRMKTVEARNLPSVDELREALGDANALCFVADDGKRYPWLRNHTINVAGRVSKKPIGNLGSTAELQTEYSQPNAILYAQPIPDNIVNKRFVIRASGSGGTIEWIDETQFQREWTIPADK